MRGYWHNDALSARVLRDGWLLTGDLARCDAAGFYYIVDRKDDLIMTSGHNVYPSEVEAVLAKHPAVQDVVVVGIADRLRGQFVQAHVVVKIGGAQRDQPMSCCSSVATIFRRTRCRAASSSPTACRATRPARR